MASPVVSKISPELLMVVVWTTTGTALFVGLLRSIVVWAHQRSFSINDALLLTGCTTFLAASILLQFEYHVVFISQRISVNPIEAFADDNLLDDLVRFQTLDYTWESLTWITIFAMKFAFLMFFKPLVAAIPRLVIYWRVVFLFTCLAFAFCVSAVFLACPKLGTAVLTCASGYQWQVALAMGPATISVDIATDLAIVSMPYYLLWRVDAGPKKKIGALIFLGLQTLMILVAAVRVAGCRMANTLDIPWIMVWQHVEASLSVATMSLAAFKSFYVANRRQRNTSYLNGWSGRTGTTDRRMTVVVGEDEFELCNNRSGTQSTKDWGSIAIEETPESPVEPSNDWPLRRIDYPGSRPQSSKKDKPFVLTHNIPEIPGTR